MRKVDQEPYFKKHALAAARKSFRNNVRRKDKIYVPGKGFEPKQEPERRQKKLVRFHAPDNFSLVNNTEEVLEYFKTAGEALQNGNRVYFDLSQIKTLTTDAIALQIAKIQDRNFNVSGIQGNAPDDASLKQLFLQSGFYEHVHNLGNKPKTTDQLIHKVTNNRAEPKIAKEFCLYGLRHVFNNEEIFEPLYNIIIEIMQNTNNHAGDQKGMYDWWMHIYNVPETSQSIYTFLDLGVGIFESLPVKNWIVKLFKGLGFQSSNIDLIEKLFAGEIKSRTGRADRGKGLPQVLELSQDNAFSEFVLITNNIYADLKNKSYRELDGYFSGTLFYWVLTS